MKNSIKNLSIIDKDLKVDGTISSKGQLVIRGSVKGTLIGEKIVIAEEGSVFADTEVSSLTIGGKFEGEITATDELVILSTGSCSGTVICKNLTVESGGQLNATVTHQSSSPIPGKGKERKRGDKPTSSIKI